MGILSEVFLYTGRLPEKLAASLAAQLEVVNRMGSSYGKLRYRWSTTKEMKNAKAFFLGEKDNSAAVQELLPVFSSVPAPKQYNVIFLPQPFSVMQLFLAVQKAEQILERLSRPDFGEVSFFSRYLEQYSPTQQRHILTWHDCRIIIDAPNNKIYTDSTLKELRSVLYRKEKAELAQWTASDNVPAHAVPYNAALWSYALHAPVFFLETVRKQWQDKQIRLLRWPQFGVWEANSQLLLLSTLWTREALSPQEVKIKSELDENTVWHYLFALYLTNLPVTTEVHQTQEKVHVKKKVGWIQMLREKLRMKEFLSE